MWHSAMGPALRWLNFLKSSSIFGRKMLQKSLKCQQGLRKITWLVSITNHDTIFNRNNSPPLTIFSRKNIVENKLARGNVH